MRLQAIATATRSLLQRTARLRAREIGMLAALFIATLAVWLFIEVLEEILEGETDALDAFIMRAVRRSDDPYLPIGPAWLAEAARDITALGSAAVLVLFILLVCGFLLLVRRRVMMWFILAATISGQIISSALKAIIGRDRPTVVPHLTEVSTASFPSGHAMLSAVVYLTFAAVLMRIVPRKRDKMFMLGAAAVLTGLVGLSRVFLGVHYPTDVLAGWTIGAAWAILCWAVAEYLQGRRQDIAATADPL